MAKVSFNLGLERQSVIDKGLHALIVVPLL